MMRDLAEEHAKRFVGRVWEDTLGYLRLYEFMKLRGRAVAGNRPLRLSSVADFWLGMLGDRFGPFKATYHPIHDGDVVRFSAGFLTDWVPKLPGQLWTTEGNVDLTIGRTRFEGMRLYGRHMYAIIDPHGKRRVLDAGLGSVRTAHATTQTDAFACLALVDQHDRRWNCDYGVPVVVSRPVFESFQKHAESGAPAVKTLEGVVRFGSDLPLSQWIPRAIGADLSRATEDSLRLRPGLPRCYVHVTSPLSIKLLHNPSHPNVTAWTMYATRKGAPEPYGYTYITLNPNKRGQHEMAADFLRSYAEEHDAVQLLTDYDGIVPRLDARIPLSADPLRKSKADVKALIKGIDKWAHRLLAPRPR